MNICIKFVRSILKGFVHIAGRSCRFFGGPGGYGGGGYLPPKPAGRGASAEKKQKRLLVGQGAIEKGYFCDIIL